MTHHCSALIAKLRRLRGPSPVTPKAGTCPGDWAQNLGPYKRTPFRPGLRVGYSVGDSTPISWVVRLFSPNITNPQRKHTYLIRLVSSALWPHLLSVWICDAAAGESGVGRIRRSADVVVSGLISSRKGADVAVFCEVVRTESSPCSDSVKAAWGQRLASFCHRNRKGVDRHCRVDVDRWTDMRLFGGQL